MSAVGPVEDDRTDPFRRNTELEVLLGELNNLLQSAEGELLARKGSTNQEYPVIFVMGPLRSGTTLFMQWLANTGLVAYPTNLLSRFYRAPLVGAMIQQLLTDERYNFRNEILDFCQPVTFESENGKTKGALAPNEFWYFWRQFLPFGELDWLSNEELTRVVDGKKLVRELVGLTQIFAKPLALKAMILNYNISFLDSLFSKALFVQVQRDLVENAGSVLQARKRQFGTEETWYSFKIPEYPMLRDQEPVTQATGQVYFINQAISAGLAAVAQERRMVVNYEAFCASPETTYQQLTEKLGISAPPYSGERDFKVSRSVEPPLRTKIEQAVKNFEGRPKD